MGETSEEDENELGTNMHQHQRLHASSSTEAKSITTQDALRFIHRTTLIIDSSIYAKLYMELLALILHATEETTEEDKCQWQCDGQLVHDECQRGTSWTATRLFARTGG